MCDVIVVINSCSHVYLLKYLSIRTDKDFFRCTHMHENTFSIKLKIIHQQQSNL